MILDIAIIGGGLSGLSLARRLLENKLNVAVFEARNRFGGRILSRPGNNGFRYDLGPGWIWPESQPRLAEFIRRYGIDVYPQWVEGRSLYQAERGQLPEVFVDHGTYGSARRIQGGTYRLVEALVRDLPLQSRILNYHLQEVTDQKDHVELLFYRNSIPTSVRARKVVITIPPRLLVNTVAFEPGLDMNLREIMSRIPTWMAGHAKAVIRYRHPFWRDEDLSGSALAAYQGAALAEIFDACSPDGRQAALSGFFALPAAMRRKYREDLEALILEQLVRLFGKEAARPEEIIIKDWFNEPLTASHEDEIPPAVHPEYGHAGLQLDHWNDKLYFGGSETAIEFGGYLEGALESTDRIYRSLMM